MAQPGDVLVVNTISIQNNAPAPIVRTNESLGSHKNVADLVARDAIPTYNRQEGMTAWVVSTSQLWRLQGGITNGDWVLQLSVPTAPTFQFTMGAGVVVQDLVAMGAVSLTVVRGNAAALATGRAIGVVTAINSPVAGQCQVQLTGAVVPGFAGLIPGSVYVLQSVATGGVAGGIILETATGGAGYPNQTPGSGEILQPVGVAKSATELVVMPSLFYTQF